MCLHSTHVVGCYALHCVEEDACRCVYIVHTQWAVMHSIVWRRMHVDVST